MGMIEHTFATEPETEPEIEPGVEAEGGLVYRVLLDELRTNTTEWVRARRDALPLPGM